MWLQSGRFLSLDKAKNLVILPYTSKIKVVKGKGYVVLSSHSELITEAAYYFFQYQNANKIYIPGENTFGSQFRATSEIMEDKLTNLGVPDKCIITGIQLNDTENQLKWINAQGVSELTILAFNFHIRRVQLLMKQLQVAGEVIPADPILVKYKHIDPQNLSKLIGSQIQVFGVPKVYLSEYICMIGTVGGRFGKFFVNTLRRILKESRPTVTDYQYVGSAKKYLNVIYSV